MNDTKITTKQTEILILLYKFRFLHTYQFQNLLNHKKPNRIKTWLSDLTEKKYINRIYKQKSMIKKPAIYSLSLKARELLKKRKECDITALNKIYREETRSNTFINHSLLIADVFLLLKIQTKENIFFATKNNLIHFDYFPNPLPDAYIVIKTKKQVNRYFLEVLDENLPRYAIRNKIQHYIDYYHSDKWENHTDKAFPNMLIVCSDEIYKQYITRFINKALSESDTEIKFVITTQSDIKSKEAINLNLV